MSIGAITDLKSYEDISLLAQVPRYHAETNPEAVATVYGDRETNYQQLDLRSSQIANGLLDEGIEVQQRVIYLDLNSDLFFQILLGCSKANTVLCGVNWRLAAPEVEYIINDTEAEIIFVGERFFPIVESIIDRMPKVKKVIALSGDHREWETFDAWLAKKKSSDPYLSVDEEDICIQMYTSGTTGKPKGVQLSNRAMCTRMTDDSEEMEWDVWKSTDVSLVSMPAFHVSGARWGVMGLMPGAKNIILPEFDPVVALNTLQQQKVNKIFLVPAAIQFILKLPESRTADFSSIEYLLYGASPIPLDLLREAIEVFQCRFVQLYGMTETNGAATFLPASDHERPDSERMNSAGKALPGVSVKVVNEQGKELAAREVGEICLKSPINMSGYWNLPKATAETLIDGYVHTGDAGYLDEDGYVYVYDRVKDMIISGGENVYPAEVESAMFGHPAIADVAVIGVPDDKWGEAVKAVVVLKEGASASAEEIIAYTRSKIAAYKLPKSVDFVAELPRNPSGKILKRELRKPYWKGKSKGVN